MKCPNCHRELSDNAKFCGYCGYRFEDNRPESNEQAATKAPSSSHGSNRTIVALLAVIIVLLILLLGFLLFSKQDVKEAPQKENTETAPEKSDEEIIVDDSSAEQASSTDSYGLLEDFADSLVLVNGTEYQAYVIAGNDGWFTLDFSEVVPGSIGYQIGDYDNDGQYELLLAELDLHQTLRLSMFKEEDDTIISAGSYSNDCYGVPKDISGGFAADVPAMLLCYTYEHNGETYIILDQTGWASLLSDGGEYAFTALTYHDGTFLEAASKHTAGSDGVDILTYNGDGLSFMDTLEKAGIRADAESILSRKTHTIDYVENASLFARIATHSNKGNEKLELWNMELTKDTRIPVAKIEIDDLIRQ